LKILLGVQRVEKSDPVCHPANLDEIISGQAQQVVGREIGEGVEVGAEAAAFKPIGCLLV